MIYEWNIYMYIKKVKQQSSYHIVEINVWNIKGQS